MTAVFHASTARTDNTIGLLSKFGILIKSAEAIEIAPGLPSEQEALRQHLVREVAQELVKRVEAYDAWSCIKYEATGEISLNPMLLPSMGDGFGVWVVGFGVALRSSLTTPVWRMDPEYHHVWLDILEKLNQWDIRRSKSADRLAKELAKQNELGAQAEEWVVEFEKKRLLQHPLRGQIRRISSDDVSAGFDILSFSSKSALRHDRFIEVKSHSHERRFFWSANEIRTAKEFGQNYCLYLVDRNSMHDPSYTPRVIEGPTPELFQLANSGWKVSAMGFEFTEFRPD